MRIGITLPQFRTDADAALDTARRAEEAGVHGVFVYDHLWPLGQPDRPALHGPTLAAALLASTSTLTVGTLVARVGLLPDAVLVNMLATLERIGPGRLIAGLGIGDAMSRPENEAAGVPFPPRDARLASLVAVCRELRARRIPTWLGGSSGVIRALAGAEADAVNRWGVAPDALVADPGVPLTWAGQVDPVAEGVAGVRGVLRAVAAAGATWAVLAPINSPWPDAVQTVGAAAASLVD